MLGYYSNGATDGPEIKVGVKGNIVELPLFPNSLVTNPVSIKSRILHDSRECFGGKHWCLVKHKFSKRKDEKKMWKKAL